MPNPGTGNTKDNASGQRSKTPPPEHIENADTESEFTVNESLRASAAEEQRQSKREQADSSDKQRADADPESEFSVNERLNRQ